MRTSTRFQVNYPSADRSDSADVPRDFASVVNALERAAMYGQGAMSDRPVSTAGSPGIQGRFYMATDQAPPTLYYDYGTGWDLVGALATGAVGTAQLADNGVITVKLADGSVLTAKIGDGQITTVKIADRAVTVDKVADALKPSAGAGAGTEALRALGTAAGRAAAGSHAAQHSASGADPISIEARQVNRHRGNAPPAGPQDGDIWEATITTDRIWIFSYDGVSTSAHKWKCIGGVPLLIRFDGLSITAGSGYTDLDGGQPNIILPYAGDYKVKHGAFISAQAAGAFVGFASVNGLDVDAAQFGAEATAGVTWGLDASRPLELLDQAINTNVKQQYKQAGGHNIGFSRRWISVFPIRVG